MTRLKGIFSDVFVWLMLGLFPLAVSPRGYSDITETKFFCLAAIAGAFALIRLFFVIKEKSFGQFNTPAFWAVTAFFAIALLSALFSSYGADITFGYGRNEGLLTLLLYVLVFFCTYGIPFKSSHLIPLGISSCVFSAIAILQFANLNPLKLYPGEFYYYAAQDVYTARFIGTLGNEGIASAFMALAIPIFFVYFITAKDRISALALVPMALLLFVLLYCGVLGGLVGAAGAIVLCIFLHLNSTPRLQRTLVCLSLISLCLALCRLIVPGYTHPHLSITFNPDVIFIVFTILTLAFLAGAVFLYYSNRKINFRILRIILALLCLAAVVLGLVFVLTSDTSQGFIFEIREMLHGRIDDSFGSNRVRIWKESLKLFSEYPILGSGPNTFPQRSQIYFQRYSPLKGEMITTYVDNAHNEILNILVNLGILGLIPFLAAFLSAVLKPRKTLGQKACAAGLWGYFFQSFFLFSICITAPYFWLFLGMSSGKQVK